MPPPKNPEVVVIHYHKKWEYNFVEEDKGEGGKLTQDDTTDILWNRKEPGHWIWDTCYGKNDDFYYVWGKGLWNENNVGTETGNADRGPKGEVCGVQTPDLEDSYTPPSWGGEFCEGEEPRSWEDQFKKYSEQVKRNTLTRYELHTNGRKVSGRKSLFVLSGSATGIGNFFYPEVDNNPKSYTIANDAIVLGDLGKLGSDGLLYKALGEGETYDVTPKVAGRRYYAYAQPSVSKHVLTISCNGYWLAPDRVRPLANYCVGQKLNFQGDFMPAVPALSSANPRWNFTGEYINHHYTDGNGCERFVIAPYWITENPTHVWYYNKGDELNANLGMFCTFDNGQTVFVTTRGKLKMYEPEIEFWSSGLASVNVDYHDEANQTALMVGKQNGDESMYFSGIVKSKFPGDIIATQLIDRWWSAVVNNPPVTVGGGTDGEFALDGLEIYPESAVSLEYKTGSTLYEGDSSVLDQPCVGILAAQSASINDSFKTYFRFRPSGIDSIYVTLGRANWNWFGNAIQTAPFSWTLTSGGITGPDFTRTHEFPTWNSIYNE